MINLLFREPHQRWLAAHLDAIERGDLRMPEARDEAARRARFGAAAIERWLVRRGLGAPIGGPAGENGGNNG